MEKKKIKSMKLEKAERTDYLKELKEKNEIVDTDSKQDDSAKSAKQEDDDSGEIKLTAEDRELIEKRYDQKLNDYMASTLSKIRSKAEYLLKMQVP